MVNTALQEKIDPNHMPRHVAIIMDGNGRWAQKNSLPRIEGHWAGVKVVDSIVTLSRKLKLEALTLYSFSDENWNRPSAEISTLMKILDFYLKKEVKRMKDENRKAADDVQKMTDKFVAEIDKISQVKEKDMMDV